jgi:hypothetical protein
MMAVFLLIQDGVRDNDAVVLGAVGGVACARLAVGNVCFVLSTASW